MFNNSRNSFKWNVQTVKNLFLSQMECLNQIIGFAMIIATKILKQLFKRNGRLIIMKIWNIIKQPRS